jgi:hypothetical protein
MDLGEKIHSWMSSYLTGGTQFVEIQQLAEKTSNTNTYTSSCKEIKYGIPQGSALGLLLFLWFINDLPQAVQHAKVVLFMDDTNILLIQNNLDIFKRGNRKSCETIRKLVLDNLIINMRKTKEILFPGIGSRLIHRPLLYLNNK